MRKYKEALEKMKMTPYEASARIGVSRQHMSLVLNGKKGTGAIWEKKWMDAFGELPEDDGIVRERSASPKVIKEKVPAVIDVKACIDAMEGDVASRIQSAFRGKSLPQNEDEFVKLMVGTWRTGVLDAGKFFASANAEK